MSITKSLRRFNDVQYQIQGTFDDMAIGAEGAGLLEEGFL